MTTRELYVGTITGVLGNILYAVIVGIMKKSYGILDFFTNILTARIPLWYFLVVMALACLVVFLMIQQRKTQLAFLKHTEENFEGYKFQWVWIHDEATGHYRMDDFWPICPQCGKQLRVELYERVKSYHCTSGHFYDISTLYSIKCDLIHKLQRDYKEYASIIDFPSM